jgi:hypothetical protein
MTIVPPAPGLIEQLRHMVQMLVDPFGQFFDGLLLELVTFLNSMFKARPPG